MGLFAKIRNHYKQIKNKILDKGFGGVWKGLKEVYFPKSSSRTWLLIDLLLFVIIVCLILDSSCFVIGSITGSSLCCGNSIVVSNTGILAISDENLLQQAGFDNNGFSYPPSSQLDIMPSISLTPVNPITLTGVIDKKNDLSVYGLPYFLNVSKIYYSGKDFDQGPKLGNSGNVEIDNLLLFGNLYNCYNVSEENMGIQENCLAYPFLLSSNTSLLINDRYEFKIDKLTFDYNKQIISPSQSYFTEGNIKLYYTVSRKEQRGLFYLTTKLPIDFINIFMPSIGSGINWINTTFKTTLFQ